jgi:hypothetical protein
MLFDFRVLQSNLMLFFPGSDFPFSASAKNACFRGDYGMEASFSKGY